MSYLHSFIYLIIAIKFCFILMAISHFYLKAKGHTDSDLDKNIVYWKEIFEFIFILFMSILLIYLFNPAYNRNTMIDFEIKLLLYFFGFLLIINAKWDTIFKEAKWFKELQKIVGK